ncbi:MAG: PIN domain-containing protein [Myxococcota bacterium]
MSFLLDASTLVELLRSAPPSPLIQRLARVPSRERWTSVITVSQLLVAARSDGHPKLMQDMVRLVAAIRVAPYDLPAAQRFAKFRATVGADLDADDVMVAAIASSRAQTLVTRRRETFAVFASIRTEDWTDG